VHGYLVRIAPLLTLSDFVYIPYTPDLTEAGNLYACRCLALDLVQASNLDLAPLRRLSAEIAADLSLRRYLAQQHISIKFLDTEPFTHPDRTETILGGRPCHVINALIARKSYIDRIKGNPEALLSAPASVPETTLSSERWGYQDLLIFTITVGMPKASGQSSNEAEAKSDLEYLIYIMPETWQKNSLKGVSLDLATQSSSDGEIALEFGGQASNRDFVSQNIRLPLNLSETPAHRFTRLAYLSTRHKPTTTISIHDPRYKRTLHITPSQWSSLWIDGGKIILAGYIEVGEFRRRAHRFRPSAHTWKFDYPAPPSLSIPTQDLLPLPQLIAWLRWIQESR
jgi:hypothetical protein